MRNFAQSIVDTARHPLVMLDASLRVEGANHPFYHSFDLTPHLIEGRSFLDLQEGRWNLPELRTLLEQIIPRDGSIENFEICGEMAGRGERTLLLNARIVIRADDGARLILLALEDVTEQRRAQDELRRMNVELEKRVRERTAQLETTNRELEAFCYSVSHDLRSPLRAMEGFSDELLDSYGSVLDAKGLHYLRRIRAGTQRLATLIDALLDLSRVTRTEMRRERVDLSALAHQVVDELCRDGRRSVAAFRVQEGLSCSGDSRLLRLVLENLLGNALKFTSKHQQAEIEFGLTQVEGEPAYFVRDNGAGFDMAYAGKLFGAFHRLHSEREFPGTGVGLATVQRIIHRHGGRTWAEGAVGAGAKFYFTLGEGDDGETKVHSPG